LFFEKRRKKGENLFKSFLGSANGAFFVVSLFFSVSHINEKQNADTKPCRRLPQVILLGVIRRHAAAYRGGLRAAWHKRRRKEIYQ
jgi:hypothetical protein